MTGAGTVPNKQPFSWTHMALGSQLVRVQRTEVQAAGTGPVQQEGPAESSG